MCTIEKEFKILNYVDKFRDIIMNTYEVNTEVIEYIKDVCHANIHIKTKNKTIKLRIQKSTSNNAPVFSIITKEKMENGGKKEIEHCISKSEFLTLVYYLFESGTMESDDVVFYTFNKERFRINTGSQYGVITFDFCKLDKIPLRNFIGINNPSDLIIVDLMLEKLIDFFDEHNNGDCVKEYLEIETLSPNLSKNDLRQYLKQFCRTATENGIRIPYENLNITAKGIGSLIMRHMNAIEKQEKIKEAKEERKKRIKEKKMKNEVKKKKKEKYKKSLIEKLRNKEEEKKQKEEVKKKEKKKVEVVKEKDESKKAYKTKVAYKKEI